VKYLVRVLAVLAPLALPAQNFSVPDAGFFRDAQGGAVEVKGIAGAFLAGARTSTDNLSIAFSGVCGVRKTQDRILFFDASGADFKQWTAPPGPALFAFDLSGKPAAAWLAASHLALLWNVATPSRGPSAVIPRIDPSWQVRALSVGASRDNLRLLADNGESLFLVRVLTRSGDVISVDAMGPSSQTAWLAPTGSVAYFESAEKMLVLEEAGGRERRFPLDDAPASIYQAGADWLAIAAPDGRVHAIRLGSDDIRVFTLPTPEVAE
jgi:hypothetical protein